jgi:excisionase family DNA binding protein
MPRTKSKSPAPTPDASSHGNGVSQSVEVLTLSEAAAYLRTTPEEVVRLVREQRLPGRKVGEDYRFLRAGIQDWLRSPEATPGKQEFWQSHFGALKDDPFLEEMLHDIYRHRGRPEVEG